jgi:hypothetical protein
MMTGKVRAWFGASAVFLLIAQLFWILAVELPIYRGLIAPLAVRAICFEVGVLTGIISLVLLLFGRGRWRWIAGLAAVAELYYSISVIT